MELTPVTYLIVLPLVFLAGFVDSVAGGGGIISLPAYLMAGIPAHLAAGTNKVVNGTGTLVAALKYFRSGKVLLRPAVTAAVCALIGSAVGTELAALISEQTLETLMLVALPCVAVFLSVKKDFGRDIPAEERPVYTPRQELLRSALIGLVFGCYDGLVGPGTGTFMILGFTALLSLDLITAAAAPRRAIWPPAPPPPWCGSCTGRCSGRWRSPLSRAASPAIISARSMPSAAAARRSAA